MGSRAVGILRQRRSELAEIDPLKANWDKITEWHVRTRPVLAQHFSGQIKQFDQFIDPKWPTYSTVVFLGPGRDDPNTEARQAERRESHRRASDAVVKGVKEKLLAHLDAILELASLDEPPTANYSKQSSQGVTLDPATSIFIVHGHDEEMKQHVARVLSQLDLSPIILHEQPNQGGTIIEKFEANASADAVSFAVVLLSPDDLAYPATGKSKEAKPRARQNVVLELGYFIGKLGRGRVFPLKRGTDLELPSDIHGVIYTPYDSAKQWRFELVRELKAAGYSVDANKLL